MELIRKRSFDVETSTRRLDYKNKMQVYCSASAAFHATTIHHTAASTCIYIIVSFGKGENMANVIFPCNTRSAILLFIITHFAVTLPLLIFSFSHVVVAVFPGVLLAAFDIKGRRRRQPTRGTYNL